MASFIFFIVLIIVVIFLLKKWRKAAQEEKEYKRKKNAIYYYSECIFCGLRSPISESEEETVNSIINGQFPYCPESENGQHEISTIHAQGYSVLYSIIQKNKKKTKKNKK